MSEVILRFLVTRPEPDASKTACKLEECGHEALIAPLLKTHFTEGPLPYEAGMAVAVTSRNGARALVELGGDILPKNVPLFTVGDATQRVLTKAGFTHVSSASGGVDALAELMCAALSSSHLVLYVAGRDRAGNLGEKLAKHGLEVRLFEAYQADYVVEFSSEILDEIDRVPLDGVLLYSPRTAHAWLEMMDKIDFSYSTKKIKFFCLAKSVASVLDRVEPENVLIADHPNETSLFNLIDSFYRA